MAHVQVVNKRSAKLCSSSLIDFSGCGGGGSGSTVISPADSEWASRILCKANVEMFTQNRISDRARLLAANDRDHERTNQPTLHGLRNAGLAATLRYDQLSKTTEGQFTWALHHFELSVG